MKTADFFFLLVKPSRTAIALVCLLGFHAVAAKSEAPVAKTLKTKPPRSLILDLPDDLISNKDTSQQFLPNTQHFGQKAIDNQQLIASQKKKSPLNVDCGMDVYQNTAPEVSISSRLTGECDFKYHY